MAIKGKNKPAKLASGRPPTAQKPHRSLSSKATRTLIRSHHQLQKALADAVKAGNEDAAAVLRMQIEKQGGLQSYQEASLQGQSKDRGGDTSTVLLDWLQSRLKQSDRKLHMLEIGALSTSNACSRSSSFQVTRIDLNSQSRGIEQQDFMARPLPLSDEQKFDIISLSLVVNYVPDVRERGEMLKRTRQFLLSNAKAIAGPATDPPYFPSLFLVLPAPCVTNSRYMDETRLEEIMTSLGFAMVERKLSSKLVYYLWVLKDVLRSSQQYPKSEVNPGKARNNFCIILE